MKIVIKKLMVVLAAVVLASGCQSKSTDVADAQDEFSPRDGIYLIERWTEATDGLQDLFPNEWKVVYDESKYIELTTDGLDPITYLAVSKSEFIPFELNNDPQLSKDGEGSNVVELVFSDSMSDKIEAFSKKYLGRQVVMIVDGKPVTTHKVRAVITSGQLQISRCTDEGCQLIYSTLKKTTGN